ncbi:glycosyltransferase SypH [Vibrio astriarenae]|nr:glycosyltransferase SypH [Vibrio sp. C7]
MQASLSALSTKVIHAHGYKANLVSKLSSGTTRQVSTFHSGETPKGLVRLYDIFDRFSAFLSAHNFTVSQAISDKIPTQTHVLNNFISVDGLTSSQGKQVAFVGRLSHEKGPDLFISVAEQLPQITFHLYGDGPMMQSLGHDSPSNLVFHGFQSDMRKVWPEIGLLLITSRYEGCR